MSSKVLRTNTAAASAAARDRFTQPLSIVVPYTDPAFTAAALKAACRLGRELSRAVTIVALQIVPLPNPLSRPTIDRRHSERMLSAIAEQVDSPVRVSLVYARNASYIDLLSTDALVVIACKHRWWYTRQERLAMRLVRSGHSVTIVPA